MGPSQKSHKSGFSEGRALIGFKSRGAPALPRPRRNQVFKHWKLAGSPILEDGANYEDQLKGQSRMTEVGVNEKELLDSLNYLDEEGLLAFPGIGEVTAEQIKENVRQADYYIELEELLEVPRFGAKRFEKLVGRPPYQSKLSLRQLMRMSHDSAQPIRLGDFRPWLRPASGIAEVWLIPAKEFFSRKEHFESFPRVLVERVGSYRLILACEREDLKGRANYILRKLPKLIRSINYERSFTTAA